MQIYLITELLIKRIFLSGPSEEILFRALPITMMVWVSGKYTEIKVYKYKITLEVLIATILFAMAHISWSLEPFSIEIDYFQVMYAFVLGYVYGKAFQKSGSVIYPMVLHGISNIVMVGIGYVFQWLLEYQ
ncbi:MAG: lysostaphin resistance A-like protein [Cellulosilyticaceae bacterium]